jgi:hypothetical protein
MLIVAAEKKAQGGGKEKRDEKIKLQKKYLFRPHYPLDEGIVEILDGDGLTKDGTRGFFACGERLVCSHQERRPQI